VLILSFRDMSTPRCSAVTAAAAYALDAIVPAFPWSPAPGRALRLAGWLEVQRALQGKHVCFLIHGFNVDRDGGYTGLGAMAQEMAGGGALTLAHPPIDLRTLGVDVVVPVLWAGDWYLPINYPFLLGDIRATARRFADFIWSAASQMRRVSFVTHSMGARVALETVLQALSAQERYSLPVFDTAVFTAAAVTDQALDLAYFAPAVAAFRRIAVVSSTADEVLSGAFPWGNAAEEALWWNDPGRDVALGLDGPQLSLAAAARAKTSWYPQGDHKHSDYLPRPLAPDVPARYVNGWSDKRLRVAETAQAVLDGAAAPIPRQPIP